MFRPLATEKDVVEGIDNQIELLRTASSTPHGYLTLIERGWGNKTTEDVEDGLTEYQVWLVRQKIIVKT